MKKKQSKDNIYDRIFLKCTEKVKENKQQKRLLSLLLKMRLGKISQKEYNEKLETFSIDVVKSFDELQREITTDVIIEAIERLEKRVSKIESKMKL